jgi:hypothetical protein
MAMTIAERAQYDKMKGYLQVCEKFTCSACGMPYPKSKLDDVYVWRAKDKMTRQLVAKANKCGVYVLCEECARKPESMTRPQIEAALAKQGLFG